jgi:hypothetical protein
MWEKSISIYNIIKQVYELVYNERITLFQDRRKDVTDDKEPAAWQIQ